MSHAKLLLFKIFNSIAMQEFALIVAGGSGTRMNSSIPKQFLQIGNLPVLMHTIMAFDSYSPSLRIILVLPEHQIPLWLSLCQQFDFKKEVQIQAGANSRFQSVRNGLSCIDTDGFVAIHDGVRPLITKEIIARSFAAASNFGNAVVAVPLKESIREVADDGSSLAQNRSRYKLIQTPQTFRVSVISKAYECRENESLTDDASVAEQAGEKIHLIEGCYTNIKITTQEDLLFAEAMLARSYK